MTERLRPHRPSWRIPALAALAVAALVVGLPTRTAAQVQQGFGASSSAFGVRVSMTISKAPLVPNLVDGGGPLAQTTLDSLGTSMALASFPYPGDVLLNLPGLVAGLGPQAPGLVEGIPDVVGANVPGLPPEVLALLSQVQIPGELVEPIVRDAPALPPYPFAAQADHLTPQAKVDLGVGALAADASPDAVSAVATSAPGGAGVLLAPLEARSTITRGDDGSLVVEATGSISGLRVGPIVIGAVSSTARMERDADGRLTRSSSFRASAIQVGALSVDLTPEGFSIGGTPVPAPIADVVNGALAAVGLELTLLPSTTTDSAVVAGGLELVRPQDFGPLGTGTISLILGQSSARLDSGALPPAEVPAPGVDVPVAAAPVGGSFDQPALPPAAGVASPRTPAASGGTAIETRRTSAAEPFDATGLYLLCIAAAALVVAAGPIARVVPRLLPGRAR